MRSTLSKIIKYHYVFFSWNFISANKLGPKLVVLDKTADRSTLSSFYPEVKVMEISHF